MATLLVQHTVDASKSLFRCLDLHQVHRFTQPGESCELGSIDGSSASGDDLSTTPVNGICVQHHITHLQDKSEGSAHYQQGGENRTASIALPPICNVEMVLLKPRNVRIVAYSISAPDVSRGMDLSQPPKSMPTLVLEMPGRQC